MNHMTLTGAEKVEHARHTMRRAAGNMDYSLTQHQRFLDNWLIRFESVMKEKNEN